MTAYYNEFDPYAAQWLENLIEEGLIPDGDVDTRSIADVTPIDLIGYEQCHFFAGIGGWPLALRLAGWPDDRPVWTGSCPCQPFSAAGKRKGVADERHLWPEFHRLIGVCKPAIVFGEQVASKDGRTWLAGIRTDLEALGYAVGAADLCAAGAGEEAWARISYEDGSFTWEKIVLGAPHIRQRLYWVADADESQRGRFADGEGRERDRATTGRIESDGIAECCGATGGLGHTEGSDRGLPARSIRQENSQPAGPGETGNSRLADVRGAGLEGRDEGTLGHERATAQRSGGAGDRRTECSGGSVVGGTGTSGTRVQPSFRAQHTSSRHAIGAEPTGGAATSSGLDDANGTRHVGPLQDAEGEARDQARLRLPSAGCGQSYWSDFDLIPCTDGKARRIEPGTFPLAHGVPGRVGRLRAYGNAIVPWLAKEFILASMP